MIEAVFAVNCKICCLGLHVTYLENTAILLQLSIYYLLKCSSIAVPIGHSLNLNDFFLMQLYLSQPELNSVISAVFSVAVLHCYSHLLLYNSSQSIAQCILGQCFS